MTLQSDPVLITLVGGYAFAAAVLDYRTQKIPNYLTLSAAVLGVAYCTLAPLVRGGSMLEGLQVCPLLEGALFRAAGDVEALAVALVLVSWLA